ncbi:MmcQ/YjbR family DNA-binding protein [Daejeonella oryzae]|uniref:MmcQ/YjbR family DNA-binding protein n=1 Tax=Daejeonella oryzae TaxID=1122943 RepID=UPI000428DEF7|nr:MmcQ/YjbR family DNA-binding protein [Daejeonella oryzae]
MDIETIREHCLLKAAVTETFPFGEDTLVFKVSNKMFLLIGLENPTSFNAKCDPERAQQLREEFEEVQPGYHMNKTHWNTVFINGRLSDQQLISLIDHSYELVVNSLPKSKRLI